MENLSFKHLIFVPTVAEYILKTKYMHNMQKLLICNTATAAPYSEKLHTSSM